MDKKEQPILAFPSAKSWQEWLAENHHHSPGILLWVSHGDIPNSHPDTQSGRIWPSPAPTSPCSLRFSRCWRFVRSGDGAGWRGWGCAASAATTSVPTPAGRSVPNAERWWGGKPKAQSRKQKEEGFCFLISAFGFILYPWASSANSSAAVSTPPPPSRRSCCWPR